jgi:glycosidase
MKGYTMKKYFGILIMIMLLLSMYGCEKVAQIESEETIIYEPQKAPSSFKESAIAYSIFPIAFADSDGNGTGDIKGIIEKLDYLKNDLNVDVIWLNPVHPSPSYHKYDVVDYYEIDPMFGDIEDYKLLLEEAHKRDIKVLLDFVINHTSSKHPWFINAKSSKDSEYHDFYVWRDSSDGYNTSKGWYSVTDLEQEYFASFWSEMPELNFENPKVKEEIKNIAKYWVDLGVDGFRIDAAKHVFDINEYKTGTPVLNNNHQWYLEFNSYLKDLNPEIFLLLEDWESYSSVSHYLNGADSAFNFDLSSGIISSVNSENRKNIQGKYSSIESSYERVTTEYVDSVFLANHDQNRLISQLGNNVDKAKLAATIEFTLPGLSWIYYGEEIGMSGEKPDESIREGYKWSQNQSELPNSRWRTWDYTKNVISLVEQQQDLDSIFNQYKELTKLKSSNVVLKNGTYIDNHLGTSFRVFSFYRQFEDKTYLVLHNLHSEKHIFETIGGINNVIYSTQGSNIDGTKIVLEPYGSIIIDVENANTNVTELK